MNTLVMNIAVPALANGTAQAATTSLTDSTIKVTLLFAVALALTLLIERLLEVLKSIYYLVDSRRDLHTYWTEKAKWIRHRLEQNLRACEYVEPKHAAVALNWFSDTLLNTRGRYSGTVPVVSGDLVRALVVKIASRALGIVIGIALAVKLNIDMVATWFGDGASYTWPASYESVRLVVTGAAIGLGSAVVHKVIETIEKKRAKKGGTR